MKVLSKPFCRKQSQIFLYKIEIITETYQQNFMKGFWAVLANKSHHNAVKNLIFVCFNFLSFNEGAFEESFRIEMRKKSLRAHEKSLKNFVS